jgi:hypothetical protein
MANANNFIRLGEATVLVNVAGNGQRITFNSYWFDKQWVITRCTFDESGASRSTELVFASEHEFRAAVQKLEGQFPIKGKLI